MINEEQRPPEKALRRWRITVFIIVIVCIIVGFLSFWPKFNYRLERTLFPIWQQQIAKEREKKLEEDKKRLGKKMTEIAEQRKRERKLRSEAAKKRSSQLILQQTRKVIEDAKRWSKQLSSEEGSKQGSLKKRDNRSQ